MFQGKKRSGVGGIGISVASDQAQTSDAAISAGLRGGVLASFGDEGVEAGIAVEGFEVVVGCDPIWPAESVIHSMSQMIERVIVMSGECCSSGKAIRSFRSGALLLCPGGNLNCFTRHFFSISVVTLPTKAYRQFVYSEHGLKFTRASDAAHFL
jgi:hypothetical protein